MGGSVLLRKHISGGAHYIGNISLRERTDSESIRKDHKIKNAFRKGSVSKRERIKKGAYQKGSASKREHNAYRKGSTLDIPF